MRQGRASSSFGRGPVRGHPTDERVDTVGTLAGSFEPQGGLMERERGASSVGVSGGE